MKRGFEVILFGRNRERLELVRGGADQGFVVVGDVCEPADVERLFGLVADRWQRLSVLVNNAGIFGSPQPLANSTIDEWCDVIATNLTGAYLCAREAVRLMSTGNPSGGRIVNVGSVSNSRPRARGGAYAASKAGLASLARSINLEGRDAQVSCTQIDVGNVATPLIGRLLNDEGQGEQEATFDAEHLASLVGCIVTLPLQVNVPYLVVHATGMPLAGRG